MSLSVFSQNKNFDLFFEEIFKERWQPLKEALLKPELQTLRLNKFVSCNPDEELFLGEKYPNLFKEKPNKNYHGLAHDTGAYLFYKMDPASVFVAKALEVQENEIVLDMCAAPGGKTLILAEALNGTGELISNEFSNSRRERLTRVLKEYVPFDKRQNVFVQGKDGNFFGLHQKEKYHKVLADVPCSGERHLIENESEFLKWTKRRSENLAVRQYSLLSSAYLACQVGGRIVYSTCSISPLENDAVVKKLIKKRDVQVLRLEWTKELEFLEPTEFGYQILPDKSGFGPMYFAVLQKNQ